MALIIVPSGRVRVHLNINTIYDDFPLYLRKPDYENVWSYQNSFTNLFCITHKLEKVKQNGLPEQDYNQSLSDFDADLIDLFDKNKQGIIVLIETFCGERNYWYYTTPDSDYKKDVDSIESKYPQNSIEIWSKKDPDWDFLKSYTFKLYD